jgi:translation initiation factor IF-2
MFNDHGQPIQEATPAVPAEITGFDDVPTTGETFIVMDDERTARQLVQHVWKINGKPMFLSSRRQIWKIFSANWKRLVVWNLTCC